MYTLYIETSKPEQQLKVFYHPYTNCHMVSPETTKWCSDTLGTLLARTPWRGDTTEVNDLNTNITAQSTVKQQGHTTMTHYVKVTKLAKLRIHVCLSRVGLHSLPANSL